MDADGAPAIIALGRISSVGRRMRVAIGVAACHDCIDFIVQQNRRKVLEARFIIALGTGEGEESVNCGIGFGGNIAEAVERGLSVAAGRARRYCATSPGRCSRPRASVSWECVRLMLIPGLRSYS